MISLSLNEFAEGISAQTNQLEVIDNLDAVFYKIRDRDIMKKFLFLIGVLFFIANTNADQLPYQDSSLTVDSELRIC